MIAEGVISPTTIISDRHFEISAIGIRIIRVQRHAIYDEGGPDDFIVVVVIDLSSDVYGSEQDFLCIPIFHVFAISFCAEPFKART